MAPIRVRHARWFAAAPLADKSCAFRWLVIAIIAGAASLVLLFWTGFLAGYPLARDNYFSVAMLHLLAELPFLIRSMS